MRRRILCLWVYTHHAFSNVTFSSVVTQLVREQPLVREHTPTVRQQFSNPTSTCSTTCQEHACNRRRGEQVNRPAPPPPSCLTWSNDSETFALNSSSFLLIAFYVTHRGGGNRQTLVEANATEEEGRYFCSIKEQSKLLTLQSLLPFAVGKTRR